MFGISVQIAERFKGNPFEILEDIWYGDNRHGTGWTWERLKLLNLQSEYEKWIRDHQPKSGKGFFINRKPFRLEWDKRREDRYE